jgi:sugar lactone lactonase YvrE
MKSVSILRIIRKTVRLKLLVAWLLLHIAVPLRAQLPQPHLDLNNDVKFERLSIEQGDVEGIIQDSKGYMWFSTSNGLKKYDGYNFTTFKHDPEDTTTISENLLNTIWEDNEGTIWVGTSEGGLSKFDPYKNQFIHFRPFHPNHVARKDGSVTALNEDSKGTIWIGHDGGKLTRFDKKNRKIFSRGLFPHACYSCRYQPWDSPVYQQNSKGQSR